MFVRGERRSYKSPHEALRDGVTGIAQEISLVPLRSAMENVFLSREPRRFGVISRRALGRKYCELDQRVGFGIDGEAIVADLSIADQQRLEILRALARDVDVIVMDEPTATLTSVESERLFAMVRELRGSGKTIVYISHFLQEVLDLADRVTVLRDGALVRTADAADETPATLVRSMLGRPLSHTFPAKRPPAGDAPVVLEVRNASRPPVCQDVSFSVRAGEIVGLAGLVGAGRSELARLVFGADAGGHAIVRLEGGDVRIRSPRDAIRAGVVYLPESRKDDGLIMARTAAENVSLAHASQVSRLGVIQGGSERRRCEQLLAQVHTTTKAPNDPVSALSGGNQQKVLFARCLFSTPKVLIADEPTRGVDVGAKVAIYELLRELSDAGMAIVIISSESEELIGLAHRVLVMRAGRIVAELEGDQVDEAAIVSAALMG
jgi:simple sugar transport system ATP-binding protein/ribose transport system ATP-binding protein